MATFMCHSENHLLNKRSQDEVCYVSFLPVLSSPIIMGHRAAKIFHLKYKLVHAPYTPTSATALFKQSYLL